MIEAWVVERSGDHPYMSLIFGKSFLSKRTYGDEVVTRKGTAALDSLRNA